MINYIVITDIGRDTDDTLALIILLYLHKKIILIYRVLLYQVQN